VAAQREAWFEAQPDLDPERLVFIDETGASTKMARTRGRAPRGERCRAPVPHGHWKTTTLIAGMRSSGVVATSSLPGFVRTGFQEAADWDGQERLPSFVWLRAEDVATASLDGAWSGRARVVPDLRYRTAAAVTAVVPPNARRWLLGRSSGLVR
jgi:hypothetical protein